MKNFFVPLSEHTLKYKYKELHLNSRRGKTNKRLVSKHL